MEARVRLAVALGGALGGLGRVGVGVTLADLSSLPWATLLVNVTGTAALALLATRLTDPVLRAGLLTGALGAWTTVSSLSVEVVALADGTSAFAAVAYLSGTLLAGVAAAVVGRAVVSSRAAAP